MKEAIRAQEHWKNMEPFRQFYLPVGRIVAYDSKHLQTLDQIDSTRSNLGLIRRARVNKSVLVDTYGSTDASDDLTFVYNDDDGMVEWKGCMEAVREAVQKRCPRNKESTVVETQVQRLVHEGGCITAVLLANGEKIKTKGTRVILSTGPWITGILKDSDIEQPPSSRAPNATGVFAFTLQLTKDQIPLFKGKPAFSQIGYGKSFSLPGATG